MRDKVYQLNLKVRAGHYEGTEPSFAIDALDAVGLTNHPKAGGAYDLVRGCCNGDLEAELQMLVKVADLMDEPMADIEVLDNISAEEVITDAVANIGAEAVLTAVLGALYVNVAVLEEQKNWTRMGTVAHYAETIRDLLPAS